jgi:hypothetical protein
MKLPKLPAPEEVPQALWARILTFTPVIMTVVATLLAGLSSSEMTQAQYFRTLAAELQSKAGDQWSFFQAKKLRAATMRNTLDLLRADADAYNPAALTVTAARLPARLDRIDALAAALLAALQAHPNSDLAPLQASLDSFAKSAETRKKDARAAQADLSAALASAQQSALADQRISVPTWQPADPALAAAVQAIAAGKTQDQLVPFITLVREPTVETALRAAAEFAQTLDSASAPVSQVIERIDSAVARQFQLVQQARAVSRTLDADLASAPATPAEVTSAARDFAAACDALHTELAQADRNFTAARLRLTAERYDAETRHNQTTAYLYEVLIRLDGAASDRHRLRSQRFFYGMLAAQAAVVAATLALAVKKRSLLWAFAAAVGLIAVSFGAYVYLFI